ncbi:MAG: cyclic pyranopterin monophosphate synthase MoaC [Fervidicoccaceae archaeon]
MSEALKMIDVSSKPEVVRVSVAEGVIRLRRETVERIRAGAVEKGDVLAVSSVAAVLAVKRTPELLPLAHNIPIEWVGVEHELLEEGVRVRVSVKTTAKTGAEMEALVGVSAALLTIWDMVKKHEKDELGLYPETRIEGVRVVEKRKEGAGP